MSDSEIHGNVEGTEGGVAAGRDITGNVRIYNIEHYYAGSSATDDIPPLARTPPLRVPVPRSSVEFVPRRDRDGNDLLRRVSDELSGSSGPIALSGRGGVGKSALAAEAIRGLGDERRYVWSTADGRPDFSLEGVLDEIATQLGAPDIRRLAPEAKLGEIAQLIADDPTVVVVDNLETVRQEERDRITEWARTQAPCPVLFTSRDQVVGARNIVVDPLCEEEALDLLNRLIREAMHPDAFSGLDQTLLINASEHVPLVLQWIVGQIDLAQSPQAVLADLAAGKGDAAERVFGRSFNLPQVGDDGRALLLAVSLFVPSATREALAEVAGLDGDVDRVNEAAEGLSALWLVEASDQGERLTIQGLTRELASAMLVRQQSNSAYARRFVEYFELFAGSHADDFDALNLERENLLKAVEVAEGFGLSEAVISVARSLDQFLKMRGYWDESVRLLEAALRASEANPSGQDGEIAFRLADIRHRRGEVEAAKAVYGQSLEIARTLGNQYGIAATLHHLANLAFDQGDLEGAKDLYNRSLAIDRTLGAQSHITAALHDLGMVAQAQGDVAEARDLYEQSLEMARKLGNQPGVAVTMHQLGILAQNGGDLEDAKGLYEQSLEIAKKVGNQFGIASSLHQLGTIAQAREELEDAEDLFEQSLEISEKLGSQYGIAATLHHLGTLAQNRGDFEEAQSLYQRSLAIKETLSDQLGIAATLVQCGTLARERGEFDEAKDFFDRGLAIKRKLADQEGVAATLHHLSILARDRGDLEEAKVLIEEQREIARQLGDQSRFAVALLELASLAPDLAELEAKGLYEQSLAIFRKLGDQGGVDVTLPPLALLAQRQGDLDGAKHLYEESLEIKRRLGDQSAIALTLMQLGMLAENERDIEKAVARYEEGLEIFELLNSPYVEKARRDLARVRAMRSH